MFSNVGWGEIALLFIVGLVLIGPERLPQLITDFRAMVLAARNAIDDARQSITGELGEDFDELRKPLGELGDLRKLNPRTAITRTLFDGDDTYLDLLSGKPAAGTGGAASDDAAQGPQTPQNGQAPQAPQNPQGQIPPAGQNPAAGNTAQGPGSPVNWADDDVL